MRFERVPVECYSGHRANERPLAFVHRGRRYEVAHIVDRWYEGGTSPDRPVQDYFKVETAGGERFILRYTSLFDAWSVLVTGHEGHEDK
ncbi:MAG: cytoplasmic protein [Deltaproteobacteria bacterium]|nr:cytoplasmic protein [Deltaproteobacteria bacterium]